MQTRRRWWMTAVLVAAAGCMGVPGGVARSLALAGWESYAAGNFGRAGSLFGAALSTNPHDPDAHAGLGRLSLQKLDLVPARQHLERALEIAPRHPQALEDMAVSYHLEGRFDLAAEWYARMGPVFEPLVRMMRSFGDKAPYRVSMPANEVRVPLAAIDPLPIVEVRIAGRGPYRFYIDTGAAEAFIDARLAQELALAGFGKIPGLFPGGETKMVEVVRIPSIEVGGVKVEELPGNAMDLSAASAQLDEEVHGILGTHFLMRFTPTIDYRGAGALVLRERNRVWKVPGARLPFVMVGDHYILARGTLNGVEVLWFVDTGLAGEAPIAATGSALVAGGVRVGTGKVIGQGGGGGSHILRTFVADRVTAGPIVRDRVDGLTDVLPGAVERRFRVRIGGMLGHRFFRGGALTFDFREMVMWYEE